MAKSKRITVTPQIGRPLKEIAPYVGPLVSRADAIKRGLKRYFLGTPCQHGHVAQRQTSNKECWVCSTLRSRARIYTDADKRRSKARRQAKRDEINAYRRATVVEQGPKRNAIVRRWYESQKGKAWWAAYADKKRAIVRNRRAKLLGSEGQHTSAEIQDLFRKQGGRCVYCFERIAKKFHADHIVPIVDGGSNAISNIQLTCELCNLRKNRMDPLKFAARMGRLL